MNNKAKQQIDWNIIWNCVEGVVARIMARYRSTNPAYEYAREDYLYDWLVRPAPKGSSGVMYDYLARLYLDKGPAALEAYVYRSLQNRARDFRRLRVGQGYLQSLALDAAEAPVLAISKTEPDASRGSKQDIYKAKIEEYMQGFARECKPSDSEILKLYIQYKLDGKRSHKSFSAYYRSVCKKADAGRSDASLNSKAHRVWQRFVRYCRNLSEFSSYQEEWAA